MTASERCPVTTPPRPRATALLGCASGWRPGAGNSAAVRPNPAAGGRDRGRADPMSIRVLLVDDQALLRLGFRMVLEAQDDITIVGEAEDGAAAITLAT